MSSHSKRNKQTGQIFLLNETIFWGAFLKLASCCSFTDRWYFYFEEVPSSPTAHQDVCCKHAEQQQILKKKKNDSICGGFGGYEFMNSSGIPKAGLFLLARQTPDIKSSVLIKRRRPSYLLDIGGSVSNGGEEKNEARRNRTSS